MITTAAASDHFIEVLRDGNPVVRAVPRNGTFHSLPVTIKIDLNLDGGGRGPRSEDCLWISNPKVGSTDTRIRSADDDLRGTRWVGSIRSRAGVRVRERGVSSEVDDVFQGLLDRMELPLFLRGFVVDKKKAETLRDI